MSDIDSNLSMLPEHAPAPEGNKESADTYKPSVEELKLLKLVKQIFQKNKRHRKQYDEKWLDWYHMFRGRQWKKKRPSYRHSEVVNFVFRTIQSLVPIQTDFRPKPAFLPQDPSDQPLSEILNQLFQAEWNAKNWDETLLEVIYDANIINAGLSTMEVEEDISGTPQTVYESVDPLYCFPDPEARDTNKRCETFVIAEPRDVAKIKRKYPDRARYIKTDTEDALSAEKTDVHNLVQRSPVDNKTWFESSSQEADQLNKEMVLVVTCYMTPEFYEGRTDGQEEEEVPTDKVDPATGEPVMQYVQRNKYPNGRKVVIANNVILEDGPIGHDDNEIPAQRFVNYMLAREFWGISEVEQIEGPQRIFNKIFSFALDVLTLTGNPIWLNPVNSGVEDDLLRNEPGLVVPHNAGAAPTRQDGSQLNPIVLRLAETIENWIDGTAGSNDITRGVNPTGVTAARAIRDLQQSSHTRIRQKSRNLDRYLRHMGRQWLSRVLQNYTQSRVFRLTNDQGVANYFRFHVEDVENEDGSTSKTAKVLPYSEAGLEDLKALKTYEIRGKFDVSISTGSALPFEQEEKEDKLLALFDRGIIDAEEVLEQSDYPNREKVLARMAEAAQAQAEAEAQAAGAQVPPVA